MGVAIPSRPRVRYVRRASVGIPLLAVLMLVVLVPSQGVADVSDAEGWQQRDTGTTRGLLGISFADRQHGVAVGRDGLIVATDDGGRTWQQQYVCVRSSPCTADDDDSVSDHPFLQLRDVAFVDRDHGWAVGAQGRIITTSNGGDTWRPQASPTTDALNDVQFIDRDHGWAVGGQVRDRSTIVATDDGGQTWTRQRSVELEQFRDVHFIDTERGWAVGTKGTVVGNVVDHFTGVRIDDAVSPAAVIVATEDGGQSWTRQSSGSQEHLFGVSFVDSDRGWTVGDNGTILATSDGGLTWTDQDSGTDKDLRSVEFLDARRGYVVGKEGTILATSDGGHTWVSQNSPTTVFLSDVSFVDLDHGYVSGGVGTVLTTHDGGDGRPSLPGAIAGTVTESDNGAGIGGAELTVTDGGDVVQTGQSGRDGTYKIEDVPPGSYLFTAKAEGFESGSTDVKVDADETTVIDIVLERVAEAPEEDEDGLPTAVSNLEASAVRADEVELRWSAVGDGAGGVAGEYVVAQSDQPIESSEDFNSARKLCGEVCAFEPPPQQVGDPIELSVGGLTADTTYHYAVAAMGQDGRQGPVSESVNVTTPAATAEAAAPEESADRLVRVAGPTRIETAVELSQEVFSDGASAAVVVRADDFADAVAAGPLAAHHNGPILLAYSDQLPAATDAELARLQVKSVFLVGGEAALSRKVADQVSQPGRQVTRLAGPSRFATAATIARHLADRAGGQTGGVVLARGDGFADALAAGPLAASRSLPVVLTHTDRLPDATRKILADIASGEPVIIIGGPAAISTTVEAALNEDGHATPRIAGPTRYATAAALADAAVGAGAGREPTFLASGAGFADGLAAAPAAHALNGTLLLAAPQALDDSPATVDYLNHHADQIDTLVIVGGPRALSQATAAQAQAATQDQQS